MNERCKNRRAIRKIRKIRMIRKPTPAHAERSVVLFEIEMDENYETEGDKRMKKGDMEGAVTLYESALIGCSDMGQYDHVLVKLVNVYGKLLEKYKRLKYSLLVLDVHRKLSGVYEKKRDFAAASYHYRIAIGLDRQKNDSFIVKWLPTFVVSLFSAFSALHVYQITRIHPTNFQIFSMLVVGFICLDHVMTVVNNVILLAVTFVYLLLTTIISSFIILVSLLMIWIVSKRIEDILFCKPTRTDEKKKKRTRNTEDVSSDKSSSDDTSGSF